MTFDISTFVSAGLPFVRIRAILSGLGAAPIGWVTSNLPTDPGDSSVALLNATVKGITIDPDSMWPYLAAWGPITSGSFSFPTLENNALIQNLTPFNADILSGDVSPAQRVSAWGGTPGAQTIAAITYNPANMFGTGIADTTDCGLDTSDPAFYQYWDTTLGTGVLRSLALKCLLWLAPPPPVIKRNPFYELAAEVLTGGGATDIVARIPTFGRLHVGANCSNSTAGDTITVKGVVFDGSTVRLTTLFTITVGATAGWSFNMDNNNLYHAIEVSVTHAGAGAVVQVACKAWD